MQVSAKHKLNDLYEVGLVVGTLGTHLLKEKKEVLGISPLELIFDDAVAQCFEASRVADFLESDLLVLSEETNKIEELIPQRNPHQVKDRRIEGGHQKD